MTDKDYKARTSPGNLKQFLDSTIHKDFLGEIDCRIEDMRDVLEEGDSKTYIATQAAIKILRLTKNIFVDLCENAKDDLMKEEDND